MHDIFNLFSFNDGDLEVGKKKKKIILEEASKCTDTSSVDCCAVVVLLWVGTTQVLILANKE